MKYSEEEKNYKKPAKHSPNAKGQGMRLINAHQDLYDDESYDYDDETALNTIDGRPNPVRRISIQRTYVRK